MYFDQSKYEVEKVCFNCNHFFPYPLYEATEHGICLNDATFEPYIDDIFNDNISSSLDNLLEQKKFLGEQEACEHFDPVEITELDEDLDNPLVQELMQLKENGQLNKQTIDKVLHKTLEKQIDNIDWKTVPIDKHVTKLKSKDPLKREESISNLFGLIAFGNTKALNELLNYFISLPPARSIENVRHKIELLKKFGHRDKNIDLLPHLIDELYQTSSNNTTRQWISAIFEYLKSLPLEQVQKPLEKMLKDKKFSYRLKNKMKEILYQ